jgi:hypothetical protein
MESIENRLRRKCETRADGCVVWLGHRTRYGYGLIKQDGKYRHTHRVSWELANGEVPDGLHVLHRCDVRACVNPDHLFVGTHVENMRDMVAKRRQMHGDRSPRATLTNEQAAAIYSRLKNGASTKELAAEYGVGLHVVYNIQAGRAWSIATRAVDPRPPTVQCVRCGHHRRSTLVDADGCHVCGDCSWRVGASNDTDVRCAPRALTLTHRECLGRQVQQADGWGDGKCVGCALGAGVANGLGVVFMPVPDRISNVHAIGGAKGAR